MAGTDKQLLGKVLVLVAQAGDAAAAEEIRDAFSGDLEFGTAGLRGRMAPGPHRMNLAVVSRAARGLADHLTGDLGLEQPLVVIGFDARHRSEDFARASAAIMTAAGCRVHLLERYGPTPLIAFAVRHLEADAGIVVTASHNPPADNGYKVYLGGRASAPDGQGVQIVPPSVGMLTGLVREVIFKGVHFEMHVDVEGYEWLIHSTQASQPGELIGMNIGPDEIHIMARTEV